MTKRNVIRVLTPLLACMGMLVVAGPTGAVDYKVDPAHSFIQFRIQHLGYSWMMGRFNTMSGEFSHDPANPTASKISVTIDTASIDTNHAERDKDVRGRFLNVKLYPEATFKSTKYTGTEKSGVLHGELTVYGVTRPIAIQVEKIGEGKDPWGGYRAGFHGTTSLTRSAYGMTESLGPSGDGMQLELTIEGIRK